jgi:hypothetical protein
VTELQQHLQSVVSTNTGLLESREREKESLIAKLTAQLNEERNAHELHEKDLAEEIKLLQQQITLLRIAAAGRLADDAIAAAEATYNQEAQQSGDESASGKRKKKKQRPQSTTDRPSSAKIRLSPSGRPASAFIARVMQRASSPSTSRSRRLTDSGTDSGHGTEDEQVIFSTRMKGRQQYSPQWYGREQGQEQDQPQGQELREWDDSPIGSPPRINSRPQSSALTRRVSPYSPYSR